MANKPATSSEDLFNLLDKELDDIADLPSFKVPATGIYKLGVKMEVKEINDKAATIAKFTVKEIVELVDDSIEEADRAKADDKFDIAFILKDDKGADNEMGWGRLKEFCQPFEAHFGTSNLRKIVSSLCQDEVLITANIKKVARKNDKEVFDARISNITVD